MDDSVAIQKRTAALDLWAAALFLNGRFGESFKQYRAAADLQQKQGDSLAVAGHWLAIAARHLAIGEVDSAQRAFDAAYRINPKDLKYSDLPFRIALRAGDLERALTIQQKLTERYAKSATSEQVERAELTFSALKSEAQGDWRNVLDNLQLYRRRAGDPDDFSFLMGKAYLELGLADSARVEFSRSLKRYEPFQPSGYWIYTWYQLGRTHEALGNRGEAERAYRRFLRYWGRSDRPIAEVQVARTRMRELSQQAS